MSVVELQVNDGRADLRLNRPDVLNAMSFEAFDELAERCASVAEQEDVHVVVVSGAGRSFCSGIDLNAFSEVAGSPREAIARAQAGFRALATLPMPTIAAVHGHALGAGLQVALACDLRVVAEDASLGLLEMRYGIIPDLGGSNALPRLIGTGRAKRMIWLAERIDGREAERIGLAEFCVPAERLTETVDDLAARIAAPPRLAKRLAKSVIDSASSTDVPGGFDNEAEAQVACLASEEFPEAITRALSRS